MQTKHNNIKAGVFVLAGLLLGLGVIFTLADLSHWLDASREVAVYFPLSDGVQGLKDGADVTLGDQPVGQVIAIEDVVESTPSGQRVHGKLVRFLIPAKYQLYWDAAIELAVPTIGSGTRLNIRSVGSSGLLYEPDGNLPDILAKDLLPPDLKQPPKGAIIGAPPASALTRSLGIDDQQRVQIKNIIANIESVTEALDREIPRLASRANEMMDKVGPVLDNAQEASVELRNAAAKANQTMADIREIAADVRERSPTWFERIERTTKSAQALSNNANEAVENVKAIIADKDPAIRATIDNIRDISETARTRTMAQIDQAMVKVDTALAKLGEAAEEVRVLMVGQRPVLERAVANFQITASQLQLAAIEVRRSPWRLLYRPTDKELEYDNLYDAARSFALAAGSLDAAARSLRAVQADDRVDDEKIKKMLDHLARLFAKYEQTEAHFWQTLESAGKKE